MGKIVALANQKGGVGKTTTAINLVTSLAVLGYRLLLVDADPQANATSGLGFNAGEHSIYDVLTGSKRIEELVCDVADVKRLSLLPSSIALVGADVELPTMDDGHYRIKRALDSIKEQYDYIFIDCSPSLGMLTVNALVAADSVLIPVQCEYFALEGIGKLLNTIKLVKGKLNPDLEIEGLLLTMYNRTRLANQVVSEVRGHFLDLAFDTVITRNVRLSEAPSYGKPVLLYDAMSVGSQQYLSLANEFVKRNTK